MIASSSAVYWGEGLGVVILKRLSDAIHDGNTIRAVIRSTGSNEDGRTPGITQPSRKAQEKLILETYRKVGLSMTHTRYFKAYGKSPFASRSALPQPGSSPLNLAKANGFQEPEHQP